MIAGTATFALRQRRRRGKIFSTKFERVSLSYEIVLAYSHWATVDRATFERSGMSVEAKRAADACANAAW